MKRLNTGIASVLACSLSLSGCCPNIDLFGSTHEVYVMAWATDAWSSQQLESWNDFVDLDHQNTALLVAEVKGVPLLPSGSTGEPEPIEWPIQIEWILLHPEGPGTAIADEDGYTLEQRIAEVRWRIAATAPAEISRDDSASSFQALLRLIDVTDAEHFWIAPGLGAFLEAGADDYRIRMDLAYQAISDAASEQVDSPYEPEIVLLTPEESYDYSTYDYSIEVALQYARYVWTTALTVNAFSRDIFVERLEPVRETSYVFRKRSGSGQVSEEAKQP